MTDTEDELTFEEALWNPAHMILVEPIEGTYDLATDESNANGDRIAGDPDEWVGERPAFAKQDE